MLADTITPNGPALDFYVFCPLAQASFDGLAAARTGIKCPCYRAAPDEIGFTLHNAARKGLFFADGDTDCFGKRSAVCGLAQTETRAQSPLWATWTSLWAV